MTGAPVIAAALPGAPGAGTGPRGTPALPSTAGDRADGGRPGRAGGQLFTAVLAEGLQPAPVRPHQHVPSPPPGDEHTAIAAPALPTGPEPAQPQPPTRATHRTRATEKDAPAGLPTPAALLLPLALPPAGPPTSPAGDAPPSTAPAPEPAPEPASLIGGVPPGPAPLLGAVAPDPAPLLAAVAPGPAPLAALAPEPVPQLAPRSAEGVLTEPAPGRDAALHAASAPVIDAVVAAAPVTASTAASRTATPRPSVPGTEAAVTAGPVAQHHHRPPTVEVPPAVAEPPARPAIDNAPVAPTVTPAGRTDATTAPGPAVAPHAGQPALSGAVTRLLRRGEGEHVLTVELHPAELGAVNVTAVVRDGQLAVNVSCVDPAAHAAVTAALPSLQQDFSQAGLAAVDVSVSADARSHGDWSTPDRSPQRPGADGARGPLTATDSVRRTPTRHTNLDRWL